MRKFKDDSIYAYMEYAKSRASCICVFGLTAKAADNNWLFAVSDLFRILTMLSQGVTE
jgi:hypothetical protein